MATAYAPGRGLDERPRPCPKCGRTPRLVTGLSAAGINCTARYECRRWFGLALCRRGSEAVEAVGSESWARRAAAVKWNRGILWSAPVQLGMVGKVVAASWLSGACAAVMAGSILGRDALATPGILALLLWIHAYRRIP